jgi:FAD synthase
VAFLERLREERVFPSTMALTEQIGRDIEETRKFFARFHAGPKEAGS